MKCPRGEVHVWRIDLDGEARKSALLRNALSHEERARAERFRIPEVRERWIAAHGALRWILAQYAEVPPETLVFECGVNGKPELTGDAGRELAFNLTHTGGLAMVGVASGARIGIDAEVIRPEIEFEDLTQRFFAKEEAAEIFSLPEDKRVAAFYRCWSRKEALVKAIGGGLSVRLEHFRVSVRDDEPARLISFDGDFSREWNLVDLSEAGIAAAVAVEGAKPSLRKIGFVLPDTLT